jgi:hypothetical protein
MPYAGMSERMKTNHYTQQELFALAAANAPNPSRDIMELFHKYDMDRNPTNEAGKPRWRTEIQIVADYKLDFAEVLFKRLAERQA